MNMKKKLFLTGMLTAVLTFGMAFMACSCRRFHRATGEMIWVL
jgi:hypothetical protein